MPKLVLNATGDQFFLPDSSQFYWDGLRGENYLRYVPNGEHGLDDTDAIESIIAFYGLILAGKKPPAFQWTEDDDGRLRVLARDKPEKVRLWQAHNPEARDFRVETFGRKYTSTIVKPDEDGLYRTDVAEPDKGWTAYFLELTYDVGGPAALRLTTGVKVIPDTLPFADKPSHLPTSLTLVCTAPSESAAPKVVREAEALAKNLGFAPDGLTTHVHGKRCYLNWAPNDDFEAGAKILTAFLTKQHCDAFAYQLESGPNITLPPAAAD